MRTIFLVSAVISGFAAAVLDVVLVIVSGAHAPRVTRSNVGAQIGVPLVA